MIVLGYHWLTHYNPLIDWVLGSIIFWKLSQPESKSSPSVQTLPLSTPLAEILDPALEILDPVLDLLNPVLPVNPRKPQRVTLINAAAYSHTSKLEGLKCFQLWISLPEITGHSMTNSEIPVDMSAVPEDYHDFVDVFSKSKAGKLADH